MTETITIEEIPVPLSLFLFRHYLNNVPTERESPETTTTVMETTPTTYFISTDPILQKKNKDVIEPSQAQATAGNKNNQKKTMSSSSQKSSTIKYRNLASTAMVDELDTAWMTTETSPAKDLKARPQKNKCKNKNKKKQSLLPTTNITVTKTEHAHEDVISHDTKMQEIISPFLLVDLKDVENDDSNEPWTTVAKR